jgi:DNA polymerase III beta subunit, central domain
MSVTNQAVADLAIDAEYARLIQPFLSRDATRYYLGGFYVQPHADGALIVATDGHTIAVFHDASGIVKKPGIIKLSATTLAACKMARKGPSPRRLIVSGNRAEVYQYWISEANRGRLVAAEDDVVIDATFPDWRRVVPKMPEKFGPATLNYRYVARFQKITNGVGYPQVTMYATDDSSPVVVLTDREDFIGVVMPIRAEPKYPVWL